MHFSQQVEDVRNHIDGGESRTMTFEVADDKENGLYWYHNHVHGTSAYSYLSSLFGLIVVEGAEDDLAAAPGVAGSREILMILSEGLVNPDGTVPPFFPIAGTFNWTGVTNGQLGNETQYEVTQGETVLFRVASAAVEATIRLSIPGMTFVILAYDGLVLPEPEETDVVVLSGGGRVEFLARFDTPGTFKMTRAPFPLIFTSVEACLGAFGIPSLPCLSYDKEQDVATIVVTESADNPAMPSESLIETVQLPQISDRLQELAMQEPVASKEFLLEQQTSFPLFQIPYNGPFVPPGVAFGINNRLTTPNFVGGTVAAGTCETWVVVGKPDFLEHGFHVHNGHYLVKEIDGVEVEKPFWRDTMMLLANLTLHVCFDRTDPDDFLLVHCHAPSHLDIGMGTYLKVTGETEPPTSEPMPDDTPTSDPLPDSTPTSDPMPGNTSGVSSASLPVGLLLYLIVASVVGL